MQLSFDERSCDNAVEVPLVPDAAALHRCTERQEGNVMDHAITWKEGTRDAAGNVANMLIHACVQLVLATMHARCVRPRHANWVEAQSLSDEEIFTTSMTKPQKSTQENA